MNALDAVLNNHFSEFRKVISHRSFRLVNSLLHHLEVSFDGNLEADFIHTPLFIIGAPRSGSTLLYQVLSNYYDVGYLSNLHCKFFGSPSLIENTFQLSRQHYASDYKSYHGKIQGCNSPSECGDFWYRFFRRKPPYIPLGEVDASKLRQFRKSVAALSCAFDKPILFKNLYCSLRLQPIVKALPEALFIVIHRDLIKNGHSLLEGRKKATGSYDTWWSVEPPDVNALKLLPCHEQVIEQICHIYALIDRDRRVIGSERFLDLSYEDFCQDTHFSIQRINEFLEKHERRFYPRIDIQKIPKKFKKNDSASIDREIYLKMMGYVKDKFNL